MGTIMKSLPRAALMALGIALSSSSLSFGQVTVVGGLSNFDCTNNTGKTENEFEIELPDVKSTDISSFWANTPVYKGSGYGLPTETYGPSTIAGHNATFVDYKTLGVTTSTGFTEHFGIHFSNPYFMPASTIYTWKSNGSTGGSSTFGLPTIAVTTTITGNTTTVTPIVTNTTNQSLFVEFRDSLSTGNTTGVQLGDLTDNNTEIQAVETEAEAGDNGLNGTILAPGQILGIDGEGHDPTDSIITNPAAWRLAHPTEVLSDFGVPVSIQGDAMLASLAVFTDVNGTRGPQIANILTAINTAVPEPTIAALLIGGSTILSIRRRRVCRN